MKPLAPMDITSDMVRRALEVLKNPQELARSPLTALKCVQAASATLTEKPPLQFGLALRQVLLEAIEQLNPKPTDPNLQPATFNLQPSASALDPAAQPYVILTSRFVAPNRFSRYESIANKLAISKSTYYRKLDDAVALLLNIIKRMEIDAGEGADAQAEVAAATVTELLALPPTPNYEYFIGRNDLVDRIKQRLTNAQHNQPCTIGLWGLPGGGKSTLLIQLANDPDVRDHFPDGILWGSLGRNPNLAALAQAWCMAMHVAPARLSQAGGVTDKIKLLHDAIVHCRVLIIVDDVWHADDALSLKVRGSNTALLLSTRFPDVAAALAGPNTFKVNALTEADSLDMLTTYAPFAVECFPDRARALAGALGGLPLALVITGQFLQQAGFSNQSRRVQQAYDRIEDALFRLALPDSSVRVQGDDPTHRTLDAVLAQSVELLSANARHALQCLSLLPQKPIVFSESSALAILESEGHLSKQDALDELVNMGLLDVVLGADDDNDSDRGAVGADSTGGTGGLYSMHQLIADYAAAACDPRERDAVQRRITRHYSSALKTVGNRELSHVALNNLLAAAQLAQRADHTAQAAELALGLYPHLEALGMWDTSAALLSPILSLPQVRRSPALNADILLKLAHSHRLLRHLPQAEAFAQSAQMLAAQFDASSLVNHAAISSRIYELQANVLMDKGEHHAAIERGTRALETALEARSPDLAEQARHTLALAFSLVGNYERMDQTLDAASTSLTRTPVRGGASTQTPTFQLSNFQGTLSILSDSRRTKGHPLTRPIHLFHCQARALKAVSLFLQAKLPEADGEAAAALDIARKSHNRRWIILLLEWLGWIRVTLGKYDSVMDLMSEVFTLARSGDFLEDLIFLYVDLGLVAKARGALAEAEQHLDHALALANQVAPDHMNGRATMYSTQARIHLAAGHFDQAEVHARLSISSADNPIETIPPLALLGYIKARQDNPHESDAYFAQAMGQGKRFGPINHAILILFATHYRAEGALHLGRHEQATADFTAAHALAERARSPEALGITTLGLARAHAAAGRLDEALRYVQASLSYLRPIGHIYADAAQDFARQLEQNEPPPVTTAYGF